MAENKRQRRTAREAPRSSAQRAQSRERGSRCEGTSNNPRLNNESQAQNSLRSFTSSNGANQFAAVGDGHRFGSTTTVFHITNNYFGGNPPVPPYPASPRVPEPHRPLSQENGFQPSLPERRRDDNPTLIEGPIDYVSRTEPNGPSQGRYSTDRRIARGSEDDIRANSENHGQRHPPKRQKSRPRGQGLQSADSQRSVVGPSVPQPTSEEYNRFDPTSVSKIQSERSLQQGAPSTMISDNSRLNTTHRIATPRDPPRGLQVPTGRHTNDSNRPSATQQRLSARQSVSPCECKTYGTGDAEIPVENTSILGSASPTDSLTHANSGQLWKGDHSGPHMTSDDSSSLEEAEQDGGISLYLDEEKTPLKNESTVGSSSGFRSPDQQNGEADLLNLDNHNNAKAKTSSKADHYQSNVPNANGEEISEAQNRVTSRRRQLAETSPSGVRPGPKDHLDSGGEISKTEISHNQHRRPMKPSGGGNPKMNNDQPQAPLVQTLEKNTNSSREALSEQQLSLSQRPIPQTQDILSAESSEPEKGLPATETPMPVSSTKSPAFPSPRPSDLSSVPPTAISPPFHSVPRPTTQAPKKLSSIGPSKTTQHESRQGADTTHQQAAARLGLSPPTPPSHQQQQQWAIKKSDQFHIAEELLPSGHQGPNTAETSSQPGRPRDYNGTWDKPRPEPEELEGCCCVIL